MGSRNADYLCQILASRGELLKQLEGLREASAGTRPEPNEWSVEEILQHEADVDVMYSRRIRDMLAGIPDMVVIDKATYEPARQEAKKDGLAGILRRAYAARVAVLELVSELTEEDMAKSARHPVRGPMTVRQAVEGIVRHDRDHAQQIAKTRAAVES